ncbi:hypothetical protein L3Q82_013532 [Scortum barcoo]|uniref:Uncharacterized protein n=1 Tax=Scortum barcoo TaxID=214431 RepID=A0ACB8W0H3_9TELE|nr:hypothetical protein L3Q82_013532 [Scortum barcoo]
MPSVWVGREPPGRPGLMSLWATGGTKMGDWQAISRMPAVTDATPDIPFRGKRRHGQHHASFHRPSGHQPPSSPHLSKDHGSDGTSFQGATDFKKYFKPSL